MAYADIALIVGSVVLALAEIAPRLFNEPSDGLFADGTVGPVWIESAVALPPCGPPVVAEIVPLAAFVMLGTIAPMPSTIALAFEAAFLNTAAFGLSLVAIALIVPLL